MTTASLFLMLLFFMLIGVPVGFSLGLASVLTMLFFADSSMASLAAKIFTSMEHYTLMAIPFFILAS
ncbi:MAG: TRAP transporter large permease subunit, partial [Gammaproteobacteria bacterium]|nr:TRAP transporter large permease subunit [Gammaproteobacteria bacterium]